MTAMEIRARAAEGDNARLRQALHQIQQQQSQMDVVGAFVRAALTGASGRPFMTPRKAALFAIAAADELCLEMQKSIQREELEKVQESCGRTLASVPAGDPPQETL